MPHNLVVILGPTATGKTKLAAKLANAFNGEIISADSRQVYKWMDIGTGKDLADYIVNDASVPCHLVDIIEPDKEYNLFLFKQDFRAAFTDILTRNKLPVLTGGTGLFLSAIINNYRLPKADFDNQFLLLQDKNFDELTEILLQLNPKLHNTTDLTDKERIIKAILVTKAEKQITPAEENPVKPLVIGVRYDREIIKNRITERLKLRLDSGMIEEVENLLKKGISHDKLMFFGLEYKLISQYLKGDINYNDMFQKLNSAIHHFAKRQMTWFRKMEKEGVQINWIDGADFMQASQLIKKDQENFD